MQEDKKNSSEKEELMQKHYKLGRSLLEAHLEGRTEQEQKIILEQLQKVINDMQN